MTTDEAKAVLAKGGIGERKRAELEALIWSLTSKSERTSLGIADYFKSKYATFRYCVLRAGVEELWGEIERGMPIRTAATVIVVKARKRGGELRPAILQVLEEYNGESTYAARTPNGGRTRRKSRRVCEAGRGTAQSRLWADVRLAMETYLAEETQGFTPDVIASTRLTVLADLDVILLSAAALLARAHRNEQATPHRRNVIKACLSLSINPPRIGHLADLVVAKAQMRRLARAYHPDARGGDESLRPQFEAAVAAFNTLDDYNRSLEHQKEQTNAG